MKRTATLVAGLLLVTGTVFAAPTFTTTGEVVFKNTVFETDKAVLQNVGDDDTQNLTATAKVTFDAKNTLTATVKEGNDDSLKLEYKNDGEFTDLTVDTISDKGEKKALFQEINLTALHEKGKVKAQVKGALKQTAPQTAGVSTGLSESEFSKNTDSDAIYLQYAVTPTMTTTFYPYKTTFGVDSVFVNDDETTDGFEGIKLYGFNGKNATTYNEDIEKVHELPGVKVEMTSGMLKGLAVKVGSAQDGADGNGKNGDAKFAVDAAYSMTVAGVTVKADAAVSQDADRNSKAALMVGATAKVATVNVQAEMLNVMGNTDASDFTGLYAKATTKVAMVDLTAKLANKKYGTATAHNSMYVEGKYTAAEVAGVKPTITGSYEMREYFKGEVYGAAKESKNTAKVVVDAAIVQDGITITPALELAKVTDTDATAKATIAVKYSF